jgi:hypothetical protein
MRPIYLFLFFAFASFFTITQSQIPFDGLVGYYKFDHTTADSSGMGNDATAAGGIYTTDRLGNSENAFLMNGLTDSLVIPISELAPLTGDFTISFWIKTKSPERHNIFSLKESAFDTTGNFEFQLNSNSILQVVMELYYGSFTYWNGSGWTGNTVAESSPGLYYNNHWHHFVIKRQNDTLQLFHNRDLHAENYFTGVMGDSLPFVVGSSPNHFNGIIDDIAFYNRAITEKEIMQLYHDGQPFIIKSTRPTDAYQQNDTVFVYWQWDSTQVSDSIDVDFRINETGPWMATTHNHLAYWDGLYFPLNYDPDTEIEIRIRDRFDSTLAVETGAFTISSYQWQLVNPALPFTSRDGSGLLTLNDKMWLIGGWDPPYHEDNLYTCSEIWSTPDGISWEYHGDAPWEGRHISGWLNHENALWVIGGDPQSGYKRDVWKSADGINWEEVLDTIPNLSPLRSCYMTASMGGNIYYFGGQPIQYVRENLNQVWRSPDGEIWEQLPDAPWQPRGMVLNSCVDDSDQLWLLGGGRLYDRAAFSDVWKTSDGINWELINEAAPWQPRYWQNVAWFDNKMWVITGVAYQTDNAEVWYSEDGVKWFELKNSPFTGRHAAAATVFENALWLMTGIITNDAWKLINTKVETTIENQQELIAHEINIFPNPTNSIFSIETENKLIITNVIIRNILGEIVFEQKQNSSKFQIDLSLLDAGMYAIQVFIKDVMITKQLILL